MEKQNNNLMRDLGVIVLSILIAIVLAKTGAIKDLLTSTREWEIFGSFLAGAFFVSIFTAAPAAVTLAEIAKSNSLWMVALLGGAGALMGDLLIFRFIKDGLAQDIGWLIQKTGRKRLFSIFHLKLFKWFVPFIGAILIASPLPDEVGLTLMGFSKIKMAAFMPISFILNFLGILIMLMITKGAF